jgi:hypothetical protein
MTVRPLAKGSVRLYSQSLVACQSSTGWWVTFRSRWYFRSGQSAFRSG